MSHTSFLEHRELGEILWQRDFDVAHSLAAKKDLPVLLLFQEIPGCSTCVNFGQDVLSNPLLAEAIEERQRAVISFPAAQPVLESDVDPCQTQAKIPAPTAAPQQPNCPQQPPGTVPARSRAVLSRFCSISSGSPLILLAAVSNTAGIR